MRKTFFQYDFETEEKVGLVLEHTPKEVTIAKDPTKSDSA